MREAWKRSRVPIAGVVAIVAITLLAFAVVKPSTLQLEKPAYTITGNVVADNALFDSKISLDNECSNLDDPVCATNGHTYRNLCFARKAGFDMKYRGNCDA